MMAMKEVLWYASLGVLDYDFLQNPTNSKISIPTRFFLRVKAVELEDERKNARRKHLCFSSAGRSGSFNFMFVCSYSFPPAAEPTSCASAPPQSLAIPQTRSPEFYPSILRTEAALAGSGACRTRTIPLDLVCHRDYARMSGRLPSRAQTPATMPVAGGHSK